MSYKLTNLNKQEFFSLFKKYVELYLRRFLSTSKEKDFEKFSKTLPKSLINQFSNLIKNIDYKKLIGDKKNMSLEKTLAEIPEAKREDSTRPPIFLYDKDNARWEKTQEIESQAIILGKFHSVSPATITENGMYPLKIDGDGNLNVVIDATSGISVDMKDLEAIFTFTGDSFEVVIDGLKTQIDLMKTALDNIYIDTTALDGNTDLVETKLDTLETSLTSIEGKIDTLDAVIDLIKTNSDKFKFTGDNLKCIL